MAVKSYLKLSAVFPIGIRRNNPGNLASSAAARSLYAGVTTRQDVGRGPLFLAFESIPHGLLAMSQALANYYIGRGYNTIAKICAKYTASKVKAEQNRWISQVSRYAGLPATKVLDASDADQLKNLCLGIIQKEVGLKWTRNGITATITAADYDEAMNLKMSLQTA